ncbi:MAG: tetratricopeptide repeat protein [Verrucomicrobiota bacterium]
MKFHPRLLAALAMLSLVLWLPLGAQEDDVPLQDQFLEIYMFIREADRLEEAGQSESAYKRYEFALKKLKELPSKWNPAIVGYRIKYCESKMKENKGKKDKDPGVVSDLPLPEPAADLPQPEESVEAVESAVVDVPAIDPAEFEQLKATVSKLEQDLLDSRNRYDALVVERDQLRTEVTKANAELAKVSQDETETQVADLLRENEQLKQQLNNAEAQLESLSETTDSESSIALLNAQLDKVRTQLAAQQAQNNSYEAATEALKKKLEENQRELMLARQNPPAAGDDRDLSKENEMLRDIIQRQLQEQARRDIAAKLAKEELDNLKIQSTALSQQIDVLGSPLIELTDEQMAMFRLSPPAVVADETATETITMVRNAAAVNADEALPEIAVADVPEAPAAAEEAAGMPAEEETVVAAVETDADLPMPEEDSTPGLEEPILASANGSSAATPAAVPDDNADVASKPRVPDDVKALAQKASEYYANARYDEAADLYEQMIERYPESLYAWSNLGVVRYQQKNYKEATLALQQAVKLSPSDGFSYSILGIVYYQTGKLDDAIEALTSAKALEANNAKTRNYLGIAFAQKGWQETAEKELREAVNIAPKYGDAHFNLAVIYATQKPPSKELARKHYSRAKSLGVPADKQLERLLN